MKSSTEIIKATNEAANMLVQRNIEEKGKPDRYVIGARDGYMQGYIDGATEQQAIDIENCVKWCEKFNKDADMIGFEKHIDVESFREWITNMIMYNDKN